MAPRPPPLLLLFKYADSLDLFLISVGSLASLLDGLALPAMTLVQSHLIHSFGSQFRPSLHDISRDCLLFTYIALISWIATYLEVSCWMHAGLRQTETIRLKYLESVLKQDPTFFEDQDTTPEVINSIAGDICLVQEAISEKAGNFIKNVAHFIGGYAVAFILQWRIALLMTPFIPFLLLPGILYNRTMLGFSVKMQASYQKANAISEQALSTIRTVYSYVGEERVLRSYSDALEKVVEVGRKQGITKGLAMGSNGIAFLIWALLGWYGATLIGSGKANGGQVLTTGFALMTGGLALGNAVSHVKTFVDGRTAASKIFRIIDHPPRINSHDDHTCGHTPHQIHGKLEFLHVTFSYPSRPGLLVLKELSVEFSPGKTVALVGSSGSGKSTIISLIQRFYDPTSGTILLDGIDIKDLQIRWLRQNMGLVNQEPALFATSIKDNLLYGKENASMEEIIAAATIADAHGFISKLPNGYDTQVGERGIQMSGGQKQRIAIARAILRNPSILLLDEATSALDSESEAVVNRALRKASFGRTTILVAHRISTIRSADTVICLKDGSIANIWNQKDLSDASDELNRVLLKIQQYSESPDGDEEGKSVADASHEEESYFAVSETQQKKPDLEMKIRNPTFWNLVPFSRSEWTSGIWGLLGAAGYGLVQPFYAYLIGELASIYYAHSDQTMKQETKTCSFLFACLAIAFFMVNTVQHYSFAVLGENLTRHVREKMIGKLLTFEVGWFDRHDHASSIICSRLASDANVVHSLIGDRISLLMQTASTVFVSTILGLCTSWRLALVMIAIQPVVIQSYFYRKQCLAKFAKEEARAQEAVSQLSTEAVIMHRTVTSFGMQPKIISLFESKLEHIKKEMTRQCYKSGVCIGVAQFILYASWALDFWYGGHLVSSGESSAGDIFKTFFVLVSTGRMLAEAGTLSPDMAKGSAALEFISSVVNKESEIDSTSQRAEKVQSIKGDIELRDVWFSYPTRPSVMIFKGLNLEIKAGNSMAIVGQSGSGKSTILSLLERFYDPCEGKVLIDGRDIRTIHLRSLRQHIALVNQEPSLFATSIRDNILYGRPNASEEEMINAAKAANAHSFISALPDGYSTCVGTLGLQVSGGQKQRIAIARAFLKNPAILLLDEATSALDAESEEQVQVAAVRIMRGRTTVVIAHRLSTIQDAHTIAVLHEGCVVEQGNHSQLLARGDCGVYCSLVAGQSFHPSRHESDDSQLTDLSE